ncbi:MAG: sulfite exporter TauE/SafE family protein [Treponema sp.]|nr:sulfite exporter TauE/SafE family protein [Treponema sp.]
MDLATLFPWDFAPWQWAVLLGCGLCIGMSKTGMSGITTVMIPFMALIFGAKESTGVVLPLLCFADLLAVIYYRRAASWKHIIRLLPWALAGFGAALVVDRFIPPKGFKILIAACILAGLAVMLWSDIRKARAGKKPAEEKAALSGEKGGEKARPWWFSAIFGVMGGFTTMIGNAAGPIMSVFLLSARLPKLNFVGTGAWFFMVVNYLKLPIQHFVWHNIHRETLFLDLCMIPAILAGAALGILMVKKLSEAHFRVMVYVLTLVSATLLFIR